jgi:hypothetical protein
VSDAVDQCALDLDGAAVLTEAATGAYVVTPVIAALAGAGSVDAVTRASRYGSVEQVVAATEELAAAAGVTGAIRIHTQITAELVGAADIVTNSGHLRPLDARVVSWMRPTAVVPLMFEAWEIDLGRADVDLEAMSRRGIRVAGTNERHPAVDVFSFLGPMAVKLFLDAEVCVLKSRVLVLCDNPFEPYITEHLRRSGALVTSRDSLDDADLGPELDAIVVALRPEDDHVVGRRLVELIARDAPNATLLQFWGDVDRQACAELGVGCVPTDAPGRGHMGVLPSAVGPEAVVRLQAGGLKVAAILRRPEAQWSADDRRFIDAV